MYGFYYNNTAIIKILYVKSKNSVLWLTMKKKNHILNSFSSHLSRDLAQPAFTFAANNQVLRKSQSGLQDISHFKKKQDEQVRFDDK